MEKIQLKLERPIAFFPQMARALGGIEEAIFVQQLYYWSDKPIDKEGWVYKTQKEWEIETTLTPKMQNRVKRKLKDLGILETKLKSVKNRPTLHYKLEIALLQKVIMQYDQREECNITKGNKHPTETTTETTTESTNLATSTEVAEPKVEIVEDIIKKQIPLLIDLFKPINPSFEKLFANRTQRAVLERMIKKYTFAKVESIIKMLPEIVIQPFAPSITTPCQLEDNLGKLILFIKKNDNKGIIQL